jgi:hypothetical protein
VGAATQQRRRPHSSRVDRVFRYDVRGMNFTLRNRPIITS